MISSMNAINEGLSLEDWKVLKTEHFLQQLKSQLDDEQNKITKTVSKNQVEVIRKFVEKTEKKRSNQSPVSRSHACPSDLNHPCCVDSINIDLHQLGWNFVLTPRIITYKFCRGTCSPEVVRPALFTKAAAQILYVSIIHYYRCLQAFRLQFLIKGHFSCSQ